MVWLKVDPTRYVKSLYDHGALKVCLVDIVLKVVQMYVNESVSH